MENKNKPTIYGLKINNQFHYIGKTIKRNKHGKITFTYLRHLDKINDLTDARGDNDVEFVALKTLDDDIWFNEKLDEIVKKYSENHPLKNAKYLCEGKRSIWEGTDGYWKGKKRDKNTLKRLEESKFVRVCQYDKEGNLITIWNSIKEPATNIFKDYKVVNGSASSNLYRILSNTTINHKFAHNSYWYHLHDLLKKYNQIPRKLDIVEIRNAEIQVLRERLKPVRQYNLNRGSYESLIYTIEQVDNDGNVIQIFDNIKHAAHMLKIKERRVKNLCYGMIKKSTINLRYGKKIKQKPLKDINYVKNS